MQGLLAEVEHQPGSLLIPMRSFLFSISVIPTIVNSLFLKSNKGVSQSR
jgi:hypothetical protein